MKTKVMSDISVLYVSICGALHPLSACRWGGWVGLGTRFVRLLVVGPVRFM